jgi:uridine kinase
MTRTIISICGGSGSGKSSLAKEVNERLTPERSTRIPTDFYLKSNPYPSLAEFFQHPLQYDWELLETALGQADGTRVTSPNYDFIDFQRISSEGGRPFVLRPIIIIDSMVPYPNADITVFVKCPDEERRSRIMARDLVWKKHVIDYWELHQVTLADLIGRQAKFDLIVDGMMPIVENVEKILTLLPLKEKIHQRLG